MKVCLLTTGQPSTTPRLVKEADALAAAGMDVTVVSAFWVEWANAADRNLLASRQWTNLRVGGDPKEQRARYWFTRVRHGLSRRALRRGNGRFAIANWALSRVTPDLIAAARAIRADVYIGHTLGALPAAVAGAERHSGRAAFDAEDFFSCMVPPEEMTPEDALAEKVESAGLPRCDYVTSASPEMSRAYAEKYGIPRPCSILNVFPLSQRPGAFRATEFSGPLKLYWVSQTIGGTNGLEDLVQAIGRAGSREIELYLQGQWAAGYREFLGNLMRSAGVDPRQVIHLPPEPPDSIVRRASQFDAGMALDPPSCRNTDIMITNKVFTYLLAGNAIAASDTKGQRLITDRVGPAAEVCKAGDIEGLAGILDRWRRDRTAVDRARRASWEWGTREYNWDLEQKKFLDLVRGVTSRERPSLVSR